MKTKLLSLFVALVTTTALWASNTITYTATKKLGGYDGSLDVGKTTFGSAITSHDFSNGIGTIICSGEITKIGDWAFSQCYGLTSITIPNSVTTIGEYAFYGCSGLTSVTIPNSVTTIRDYAFSNCSGLTSIDVDAANTHFVSVDGVLFNYAKDILIQYPASNPRTEYTIPNSVTTIGIEAFSYCRGLTSITIPNSVTAIGESAFSGCSSLPIVDNIRYADTYLVEAVDKTLSTYTIKEGTKWIGDYAFKDCSSLTSITIPNSVTTIGFWAFCVCYGLTSVAIPSSVTTIDYEAFCACSGLTSVTIPNSVTTIGGGAFANCRSLISIDVDAANTHFVSVDGVLFNYAKDILIQCPAGNSRTEYTIPNSVTTIEAQAFFGCVGLTSVTIPNSVTTIGEVAFDGCSGLTSVTIPNSVTTIRDYAFSNCSSLTSVTIPNSVTTIGYEAFADCYGLTSVTIPNSVTTIGEWAFYGCSGLTSITIPNSVTTIGDEAFFGCKSLISIVVDAANTHYASIDGVLFNYAKDTLIQYPIGNPRTEYTIPNSVTTIRDYAFSNCSGLTSITIPNSVTTIRDYAFSNCSGLTSVTIPNSVTTIGGDAFNYCRGLTSVTIPNSVTTIGDGAFWCCSSLTSITIPNSVTTIGDWAFDGCSGLSSITCEAAIPPACGYECFYYVDTSIPLYVPAGSVEAYKAAYQWEDFTNIRPISAEEVEVTEIEAEPTESAVEIAWPSVVNAETYTIEIRLGDQLICSIVFNAQGQLVSINFNLAPGRGGHTYATTAESTANGWAYTIAGLNPGTEYTYSVIAKNADDRVIDTKSGTFTTKGVTAFENVSADVNTTKSLHNGQVIIRQGNKTYNTLGQEL